MELNSPGESVSNNIGYSSVKILCEKRYILYVD